MTDIQQLHKIYRDNLTRFSALVRELSDQLQVSALSLGQLEVGFNPDHNAWVFPERNELGEVIGLLERYQDGSKYMVKGSKRGLIYGVNYEKENYEKKKWVRVSKENPCTLCGKSDGCMYPDGEPTNPAAVVCVHISDGSEGPLSSDAPGYLHIFDPGRNTNRRHKTTLPFSPHPVLVVEGASDTAAGMDLGFVTVGKPSAEGGIKFLSALLKNRHVCVHGENDAGAGKTGMESTFACLTKVGIQASKILPPEQYKDLRQWKTEVGLTQTQLLGYIKSTGDSQLSPKIFKDDIAYSIADQWLKREKTKDGKLWLRMFRKGFVQFNGRCYEDVAAEQIHGQLYNYLSEKSYIKEDASIKTYKPTRAKVGDILDACNAFCHITDEPPCWLTKTDAPNPARLITFRNGILDVNDYMKGKITLHNPTPDLFTFTVLPYDFDENLESKIWTDFLEDIFNDDKEKIRLLSQWFGYNCVPDLSYEKLMLFTGRPRSGKSTVLEALQAVLGDTNCCETSFQALGGAFGYQPLIGKLSAIIGDAKSPRTGEAEAVLEKILHITGGDAVSVNRKNVSALPLVRLYCRFTIAMNDLPAFTDHSRALEYRTNIIKFNNSYVGREDRTLKARLKQEAMSGRMINFGLRGLADLYKGRDFVVPEESAITMRTFRQLVSPIVEFVESCTERDETTGVPITYLYDLWKWWCAREGRQSGLKSTFIRNFLAMVPEGCRIREREVSEDSDDCIMGVKITEWANKEYLKGA